MVKDKTAHIIMPVKDSMQTAEEAIRAIVASGHSLTVYDDNSTQETAERLDALSQELGIRVIHIGQLIDTPSPNYRWVLCQAQQECIAEDKHLVIVESDVIVKKDTIDRLLTAVLSRTIGLVAAVTTDANGEINFPYEYAQRIKTDGVCKKRLSFCCTLLTLDFLRAYDFGQLDPTKNWYDVFLSHKSVQLGFDNILQVSNPVLHKPHSSRPWKQLKYTNPLLYYWRKLTQGRDKI
ncbi:MAG: glycosyltransferase [Paludibacteraceae bacterium]|nr:glycosyltransferase [Paludibacteraceae bacterium]